MCFAVDHFYCWFVTSTPFRGLACIFNRACTAACCPLPHLEAEQVIFLETVAFCPLPIERLSSSPEYWIWNKPLYLNPRSVSELFGPNPHMLTATEARSVTDGLWCFLPCGLIYSLIRQTYFISTLTVISDSSTIDRFSCFFLFQSIPHTVEKWFHPVRVTIWRRAHHSDHSDHWTLIMTWDLTTFRSYVNTSHILKELH